MGIVVVRVNTISMTMTISVVVSVGISVVVSVGISMAKSMTIVGITMVSVSNIGARNSVLVGSASASTNLLSYMVDVLLTKTVDVVCMSSNMAKRKLFFH